MEGGAKVQIEGKTALNEYLNHNSDYTEIEKTLRVEDPANANHLVKQTLKAMVSKFAPCKVKVFLTGSSNFRKDIATILPYKGNRDPFDKPVLLPDVRDYLVKYWKAEVVEGMEADDAMGIQATTEMCDNCVTPWKCNGPHSNPKRIICSNDKDMKMIPGWHYDWIKDLLVEVDERTAWFNFFKQMLVGDRTDNIPGLEGVGDKTAEKILAGYTKPETMWVGVFRAYFDRYELRYNDKLTLKEALQEIADLLWIRRANQERWMVPE